MTVEELKEEIDNIRNLLSDAPELNLREKRRITIDRIEVFFDMCDKLNNAVDHAYDRLDDLTISLSEMEGIKK